MYIYMLKFGVSGVKNIEKYIELHFYKKQVTIPFNPFDYRVKAIYGENGTGKTAIVTAVWLLKNLLLHPDFLADSRQQMVLNELVNKKENSIQLYAEFYIGLDKDKEQGPEDAGPENQQMGNQEKQEKKFVPKVYSYAVELERTDQDNICYEISHEKIMKRRVGHGQSLFKPVAEISHGKIIALAEDGSAYDEIVNRTMNLLTRQTFIATAFDLLMHEKKPENLPDVYLDVAILTLCGFTIDTYMEQDDSHDFYFFKRTVNQFLTSNQHGAELEKTLLDQINSYISVRARRVPRSLFQQYQQKVDKLTAFIKLFKPGLDTIDIDRKAAGDQYDVTLMFNYGEYAIDQEFESTGIKKLIRIFDSLNFSAAGGISFVDELDANINDVYFTRMVEFMQNYGEGQFCFTTHNVSSMDSLQHSKQGIDFLTLNGEIVPWSHNGNYSPRTQYQKGMIEGIPFNIEASDFLGILGGE